MTISTEFAGGCSIEQAVMEMLEFADANKCNVKTVFNGITVKVYHHYSKAGEVVDKYMSDCERKTAYEKKFYNDLTLDQVLRKMGYKDGKMKFPCYRPALFGNDYGRYIKYYAFRSIFDPRHECSIFLRNLFGDDLSKHFIY